MVKIKQRFLFLLVSLLILSSCTDDDVVTTPEVEQPEPITPDLSVKVTSSVTGFVTNESGDPVSFASVTAGDKQTVTDKFGFFEISSASMPEIAGVVKITKTGFFEAYKTFLPEAGKETFLRTVLMERTDLGTVASGSGGTIAVAGGGTVELAPNSVVMASNGVSYTGDVHVYGHFINISADNLSEKQRPGDSRGVNADGHLELLKSYGAVAIELTGDGGQLLQLMDGKPATVSFNIPGELVGQAPAEIKLWSFDTASGLWKQEGTATRSGNTYTGTVTHFSFWEGAEGLSLVNFSARIVDAASQPIVNTAVVVTIDGMPRNAGHGRFGYTDANGYISGAVFANQTLDLYVSGPCMETGSSFVFNTGASDIDLGNVIAYLGDNGITFKGTATNCANQPVANGYVQMYNNGVYNRFDIVNGIFNYTGLGCTTSSANVVVVDNATFQQNEPATVDINTGLNDLGTLKACGVNTLGEITYTIDGITTSIIEPVDTLAGYWLDSSWTQIVTLSGEPNTSQQMAFQFDGGLAIGTTHKLTDVFSIAFPSGRGYWPVPVTVTITEYGEIGGFIKGEFSSNMLDFVDNSLHTMSCSFKVRRMH